jgi:hypothetical protein
VAERAGELCEFSDARKYHETDASGYRVYRCAYLAIFRSGVRAAPAFFSAVVCFGMHASGVGGADVSTNITSAGARNGPERMTKLGKTLEQVLRGTSDANVSFSDLLNLLRRIGFQERTKGSHHIFCMANVEEILNLQPLGSKCKPYQVKQVRHVILKYRLAERFDA